MDTDFLNRLNEKFNSFEFKSTPTAGLKKWHGSGMPERAALLSKHQNNSKRGTDDGLRRKLDLWISSCTLRNKVLSVDATPGHQIQNKEGAGKRKEKIRKPYQPCAKKSADKLEKKMMKLQLSRSLDNCNLSKDRTKGNDFRDSESTVRYLRRKLFCGRTSSDTGSGTEGTTAYIHVHAPYKIPAPEKVKDLGSGKSVGVLDPLLYPVLMLKSLISFVTLQKL